MLILLNSLMADIERIIEASKPILELDNEVKHLNQWYGDLLRLSKALTNPVCDYNLDYYDPPCIETFINTGT